jgi:undecaprenyl-diphosphatase
MSAAEMLGIAGAVAFVALFVLYRTGAMVPLDQLVQPYVRALRDPALDGAVAFSTSLGSAAATLAIATVFAVTTFRTQPRWGWVAPIFIVLVGVAEFWVKHSLTRPIHPGELVSAFESVLGTPVLLSGSFPSGHVARTAFLASIGSQLMPRVVTALLAILVGANFFARMIAGAHRPSEVLAGLALGLAVAGAAAAWLRWRKRASRPTPPSSSPDGRPTIAPPETRFESA